MERSSQLTLVFSVFLLIKSASANAYLKSVFVFGDSLFDPGNNHYVRNCTAQADFPPYGSSFFDRPTGRFTNGRTVADFIAQYMKIKFQRPFQEVFREIEDGDLNHFPTNGINFASGGSGVLPDTNKDSRVTSIQAQVEQFRALIRQNHLPKKQIMKSLFFFESGSNDIFTYFLYPDTPPLTPRAYVRAMLKEVVSFLDQIYELGARRIAIFSVGPVGCIPARVLLPGASKKKCYTRLNNMVKYYNAGLEVLAYSMPIKRLGAFGVYGAVYNTIEDFRANGTFHGFTELDEACCGDGPLNGRLQCGLEGYEKCSNPYEYFFWDYFHPSEHTYELVSKALWEGSINKIRPINLKTLALNRIIPFDSKTSPPNNTLPSP